MADTLNSLPRVTLVAQAPNTRPIATRVITNRSRFTLFSPRLCAVTTLRAAFAGLSRRMQVLGSPPVDVATCGKARGRCEGQDDLGAAQAAVRATSMSCHP